MANGVLYEQPGLTLSEIPTIAPQSHGLRLVVDTWDDAIMLNLTPEQAWKFARALQQWALKQDLNSQMSLERATHDEV